MPTTNSDRGKSPQPSSPFSPLRLRCEASWSKPRCTLRSREQAYPELVRYPAPDSPKEAAAALPIGFFEAAIPRSNSCRKRSTPPWSCQALHSCMAGKAVGVLDASVSSFMLELSFSFANTLDKLMQSKSDSFTRKI